MEMCEYCNCGFEDGQFKYCPFCFSELYMVKTGKEVVWVGEMDKNQVTGIQGNPQGSVGYGMSYGYETLV